MAAAPTGWTRDATTYDHAIVITSGTPSPITGGTANFTAIHPTTNITLTASGSLYGGATSADAQDIPTHTHPGTQTLRGRLSKLVTGYYPNNPTATQAPYYYATGTPPTTTAGWSDAWPTSTITAPNMIPGNRYKIAGIGNATPVQLSTLSGGSLPNDNSATWPQPGSVYTTIVVGDEFTCSTNQLFGPTGIPQTVTTTVYQPNPGVHSHTGTVNGPVTSVSGTVNLGVRYVDLMIAIKNGAYGATLNSQTATTVAKGGSVSITWNTPTTTIPVSTTLYWTIVNTGMTGAVSSTTLSGSFVTTGATFVQAITITNNNVWDNGGTFIVQLRSDSVNGTIMAASQQVTITETAPTATFTVTPTSITEGNTGTFTFTSTRLKNGEILTYTVNNTTSSNADFSSATGSVVVTSNTGTFTINPIIDLLIEGTETFTVSLITSSGLTLATSTSVNITDIPPTVTFTVVPTTLSVNTAGTFTITTTNVPNGTGLTWQVSGGANYQGTYVNSTGTVYIYNNTGTFYVTPNSVRDIYKAYAVSNWTFGVIITNSAAQTLQTSSLVTVNNSTVVFATPTTSFNQGQTVRYNITTTNIPNGTQLVWKIAHYIGNDACFSAVQGYVTINNNTGSFTISATRNNTFASLAWTTHTIDIYDFAGTFKLTGSGVGVTPVTYGVSITVYQNYPADAYTFITPPISILEGQAATLQFISTTSTGTINWIINNTTTSAADFTGSIVSGTITLNGTTIIDNTSLNQQYLQTFTITTAALDTIAELTETFTVSLSTAIGVVATSNTISIIDVQSKYYFVNPATYINEGSITTYTVNSVNTTLTTLYWGITNITTVPGNFSGATTGSITLTAGSGTFSITTIADGITSGDKAFTINVTDGNNTVASVSPVVLVDSSKSPTYTFPLLLTTLPEGVASTINFQTTGVNPGTYYWTLNNLTSSNVDFASSGIAFNGTTDYISTSNTLFALGTSDFTIEFWFYATKLSVSQAMFDLRSPTDARDYGFDIYINATNVLCFGTAGVNYITYGTPLTINTWYHVAITRSVISSVSSFQFWLNGASQGTVPATPNFTNSTIRIGNGANGFFNGVISYVRLVKDTGIYTNPFTISSTPTSLSIVPNTILLTCITNTFDSSGLNNTITVFGTPTKTTISLGYSDSFSTSGTLALSSGSFSVVPYADSLTEGFEFFTISVRTTSTTGPIVATSNIISITDTSFNPTYAFAVPTTTSINEGASISYTVNMTDVPIGTTLYWTIAPTVTTPTSSADFTAVSGSFLNSSGTASSSSGTFTITALADSLTEGDETFKLEIRIGSITGTVVLVSPTITVVDTSFNPTYAFSVPATSINEGTVTTYTLNTTDVPIGTLLYYTIESISTSTADFSSIVASSVYFPGNGYLTPPNNATFGLGTNDFTIECWVYTKDSSVSQAIYDTRSPDNTAGFDIIFSGGRVNFGTVGVFYISGTTQISSNTWYHVALSRSGDIFTLFVNGFSQGTRNGSLTLSNTATRIGWGLNGYLTGYISNLRVVKGTGLYSNNFTPIGPLTNIAQTILLTCKGPTVNSDNSSYSWNISTTGTTPTVVTTVSPSFTTSASSFVINNGTLASGSGSFTINAISDSLTEGNETFTLNVRIGSNTGTVVATVPTITIVDTSLTSSLAFASPTISINEGVAATYTVNSVNYPIGAPLFWNINHITTSVNDFLDPLTYNNSVGFGGAGGLSIASSSNLALGTGDWTIEAWIYPNNVTTAQNIIIDWRAGNNSQPVLYLINNVITWRVNSATKISGGNIVANTWQHIALVKNNYNVYLYINGVYQGYTGDILTYATDATVQIGKAWDSNYWNGYITNLRVVKGVAVYNTAGSNFTVPIYQLNNIPRTILLACQGPTITSENSNGNYGSPWTINTVGTAPILSSTTIPFVGTPKATSGSFNISSGTLSSGSGTFSIPSPTLDLLTEGNETFSVRVGTVNTNSYNLLMGTTATPTYDAYGNPFTNTNGVTVSTNGSGYSLGFNGTSQYLAGPTGLPFITTGPFTIEAWIYPTKFNTENCIVENAGWSGGNNFGFKFVLDNTGLVKLIGFYQWNVVDVILPSTVNVGLNYWSHVAVTRDSTDFVRMFINGVMCGTATYSRTLSAFGTSSTPSPVGLRVGAKLSDNVAGSFFAGSISNLRILNSVAVYTTDFSANLPSLTTPLLSTGAYIDSPTITVTDISLSPTYTFSSPITSINEGTVTTYTLNTTNVPIGTKLYWKINHSTTSENDFSPLIAYNNSVSFTGSGYLSIANAGALALGSGDFTVECWCYTNTITAAQTHIFDTRTSATGSTNPNLYLNQATMRWLINGTSILTGTIPLTTWTHVAVVKSSGIITMYINGNSTSSVADTVDYGIAQFQIGKAQDANYWNGYITNFRMVKGVAVYTTLFTPSIYQLTNITGTLLLACQGPTVTTDNSTGNGGVPWTITTAGTTPPTLSASNVVNFVSRGTSGEFTVSSGTLSSGSGSFSITPLTDSLTEGNETFTIEIRTGSVTGSIITTSPTITIPANIT